ncbi:MAG: undecaprenyldiphospho-muramoylpentapeptide beta-N-acetylglucosaminyltransferase [Oligoflexia bacterium]|nr:undecaprenyldiphospho-muramoylpentapeptide beta-N-acetylglucosaminyltransferase [Oligoflexia bacterium]
MMDLKKIVIAGGGTAGHVNAGIAILDEYKKSYPDGESLFIGTKRGLEKKLIPRAGYNIKFINARGLKREKVLILIYSLVLIPFSVLQSLVILSRFKPRAVIGVGGFASGPVLLAAILLGKKIFILEQNTVMGFTNRFFVKFAEKAFLAFPLSKKIGFMEQKLVVCGNPVRSSIKHVPVRQKDNFNIFIFGGSQGARAINYCVIKTLPLLNNLKNINVIHQTGRHDFEKVRHAYRDFIHPNEVINYILDIENVYKRADLIIARAGASTISELVITGIPSILIPLPTAADNHQYYNAKYLSDCNAAILVEQKDLTAKLLFEKINTCINSRAEMDDMRKNLDKLSKKNSNAPAVILKTIEGLP